MYVCLLSIRFHQLFEFCFPLQFLLVEQGLITLVISVVIREVQERISLLFIGLAAAACRARLLRGLLNK